MLRENGGAPRVLVLWDNSGSQPTIDATFGATIGASILSALPTARVQVRSLDALGAMSADGYTLTDATSIGAALASTGGVSSTIYEGVLAGLGSAPTLVVLFTDGDAGTDATLRARCLAACPACPILVVGCYATSASLIATPLTELANASGGKLVDAGDLSVTAPITAAIAEVGGRRSASPYRLAYRARTTGPATRNVVVRGGSASGTTSYTVPAVQGPQSEIVGIHLRIEMDGVTTVRTMAGLPQEATTFTQAELLGAAKAAHDFMLGSAWLSVEGAAPTLSAWLDDTLGAAIGHAEVERLARANDKEAFTAAASAPIRAPLSSLLAHAKLFDAAHVLEAGPRMVLHTTLPLAQRVTTDILPTTRFRAIGLPTEAEAFDATLRATLRLATAEEAMARTSTASLVKGALQTLAPGLVSAADVPPVAAADKERFVRLLNRYADSYRVVVKDGSTLAFWSVDRTTGTALGVLPDGSGGAVEDCMAIVDFIETSMDDLLILIQQLEMGAAEASAVVAIAAVGKAASIAVAEAALSFTDPIIDPSILHLGAVLVCEGASEIASHYVPVPKGGGVPKIGKDFIQNLGGDVLTQNDPICKAAAPCTGTKAP